MAEPDRDGARALARRGGWPLAVAVALALPLAAPRAQPAPAAIDSVVAPGSAPVELHGVTLYDGGALLAFAGAVARQDGTPDLDALARILEQLYHEDGWFLAEARAFRDPASGRQGIVVEEGRVRAVEVVGVAAPAGRRIAAHLAPLIEGSPLRLDAYERALMLAGDLAGIALRSEFVPDPAGGGPRAVVHAQQRRLSLAALVDNVPRASAADAYLSAEAYSLLATGDLARIVVGGTSRTDASDSGLNGAAFYRLPIGTDGLYAEAYASNLIYTRELDGSSSGRRKQRGELYGALVGYPVLRRLDRSLYVMLEGDHRVIDLDGRDPASERSNALRVSVYYTAFETGAPALRAGLTLSAGDAYSARDGQVDRSFWHLRAVAGAVLRLGVPEAGYALRIEGYARYSPATLPETERMVLGDRERMRGYAIGTATGDSGAIGTVELSRHMLVERGALRAIRPSVFVDAGTVRRNSVVPAAAGTPLPGNLGERTVSLASAGLALRAEMSEGFVLSGWIGVPLADDGTGVRYSPAAYLRLSKAW